MHFSFLLKLLFRICFFRIQICSLHNFWFVIFIFMTVNFQKISFLFRILICHFRHFLIGSGRFDRIRNTGNEGPTLCWASRSRGRRRGSSPPVWACTRWWATGAPCKINPDILHSWDNVLARRSLKMTF